MKWQAIGKDNAYMYEERLAWITAALTRRYGETMKTREIAQELHLGHSATYTWCFDVGLTKKRICGGTYLSADVARAVVDNT